VRHRLDFDRAGDPELLKQCLELALQAPTGSLRQDWHFVVSTDADQCRAFGKVYKEA
jgi:nitroreductase